MKKVKPETEIRNLKKELNDLRTVAIWAGIAPLIVYIPLFAVKNSSNPMKAPLRKLNKKQRTWILERAKEFKKMLKNDIQK